MDILKDRFIAKVDNFLTELELMREELLTIRCNNPKIGSRYITELDAVDSYLDNAFEELQDVIMAESYRNE